MKKKVLFVIDSLTCGGAEKSLVSLLPLLDYSRIQVDLLIVTRGGIFERYIPSEVNVYTLPSPQGIQTVWSYIGRFCFSFALRFLPLIGVRKNSAELNWMTRGATFVRMKGCYDVAIGYQQGFSTYYVAQKVTAKKKVAWINIDLKKESFDESYNRPFYDKMDCVVAVSKVLCQMLRETTYVNSDKLCTIYDVLVPDVIRKMAKERGFEDHLPLNAWRIVTVGRMVSQKNYNLAVETAKLLKQQGLVFRWYFIGKGPESAKIRDLIFQYGLQEDVVLMGLKENPYPFIAGCDIYVQPSLYEGFGLTLAEARILHKPEVSTNFPVVYDQIQDEVNGLIAEMTAEDLSRQIMRLVNDSHLRARIIEGTQAEVNTTQYTELQKVNSLIL